MGRSSVMTEVYRHEIDSDNGFEIKIWNDTLDNEVPFLVQPVWPSGDAWNSLEEANAWAEAYISSKSDAEYEFLPGSSPEEPTILKSSLEGYLAPNADEDEEQPA